MNESSLLKFLILARSHTFAAESGKTRPLVPQTTQLEYRHGPWFYRDIFDGEVRFQGREVIYYRGKAVWGMVYEGGVEKTVRGIWAKTIYRFLQTVLLTYVKTARVVGEVRYSAGQFTYICATKNQKGIIEKFWGEERIVYKRRVVYQLAYGGGWIIQ